MATFESGITQKHESRLGRAASGENANAIPKPPSCTGGTKIV
jgi:hypothetical protein